MMLLINNIVNLKSHHVILEGVLFVDDVDNPTIPLPPPSNYGAFMCVCGTEMV